MEWLSPVLMAVQVISALSVIVLVLLQQGKGADMGSSFGSGSAGSLFGAAGAANFLSRTTKWAAVAFFASTIGLAWVTHQPESGVIDGGVMQGFDIPQTPASVPSVPGGSASSVPGAPASVPQSAPQAPAAVPATPTAPEAASVPAAAAPASPEASAAPAAEGQTKAQ